jgi:hypothetical protein
MRRPALKEFRVMECGTVLETVLFATYLEDLIMEWAHSMGPTQGQLPSVSGREFAIWLNNTWTEWAEEPEVSVQKILEGAVTEWCGGRAF